MEDEIKIVYAFNLLTKEYEGPKTLDKTDQSPISGVWQIPCNMVEVAPPEIPEGHICLWDGTQWIIKEYEKSKEPEMPESSQQAPSLSERNAKTSEIKAATSEANAKVSETNAGASETASRNWAVSETSPDGATDTDSSTGKTQSARSWAMEAKTAVSALAHLEEINRTVYYLDSDGYLCEKIFVEVSE